MQRVILAIFLVTVIALSGCATRIGMRVFLRDNVELSYIKKVAVLPLNNASEDKNVAFRMRNILTTQVLSMKLFDLVDQGLVDSAFREEAIKADEPLDLITIKRLGRRLNVDAFLIGAVDTSGEVRKGTVSFPEVGLTLRLVEAREALLLWQASGQRSGYSTTSRLFGTQSPDAFHVTLTLIEDMLKSMPIGDEPLPEGMVVQPISVLEGERSE